jgi:hypothetical protein
VKPFSVHPGDPILDLTDATAAKLKGAVDAYVKNFA